MKAPLSACGMGVLWLLAAQQPSKDAARQPVPPAPRAGYSLFTDPGHRYAVEFPRDWRWMIIAGSGEALTAFVQPKDEAAVIVERFRMKLVLAPNEITDVFAEAETELLKENQPNARDIAAKVVTENGKKVVLIDYTRPGVGEPGKVEDESVRQYSLPVKGNLYRITCAAMKSKFSKYEPNFLVVFDSLKSAEEISGR